MEESENLIILILKLIKTVEAKLPKELNHALFTNINKITQIRFHEM